MVTSPHSQSWYRIAKLKPQLAARAEISPQDFRGVTWFVLRDPVTGKFNRLSDSAYNVVAMMNGERSVSQIWDLACTEFGDDAPTQDELLAIVAQLHSLDLLITDGLPNAANISERGEKSRRKGLLSQFLNPLALRFPLFDPDTLISELWPLVRPLFNRFGALLYAALIIAGALAAIRNWEPLTSNLIDRILSAQSLAILALVYPFVKLFHELGHGFAVKKYGGEVREVGVMFLVFIPVPYVDASAATSFTSKWKRMFVGSAGILVELALAAIAMLIWTQLEEGFWRAASFNVMIIGGVSTLLFNGNPLLRFDGYFVLSDYLEIPNLGNRSNKYLGYLIQRYLFGMDSARSPVRAKGEAPWFFFYSIAAFIYRIFISFAIISIVAVRFFIFGVLFAIWSVTLMFLLPIFKHLKFLATDPRLRGLRGRAWVTSVGLVGIIIIALGFVKLPYRVVAEGVLQGPDHATVYSTETGRVDEILERTNTLVEKDAPILILGDPFLEAQLEAAEADARQYELRYRRALSENAFDVRFWREQMIRSLSEQEHLQQRIVDLTLRSPRDGTLVIPRSSELQDRFVQRGDVIAYIVDPDQMSVRTAVSQDVADLIRRRTQSVSLRPAEDLDTILEGQIVREVPTLGKQLPSLALSVEGGGQFALDPSSETGPAALQPIMQFDIEPLGTFSSASLETRVYVRFDFGSEPIASRIWRTLRQIFLSRFDA